MANSQSTIHLVRPSQAKPKHDPADIASEVLSVVQECRVALSEFEDYKASVFGEMAARMDQLEVSALRSVARKARRS
jgi:hypothetical protein